MINDTIVTFLTSASTAGVITWLANTYLAERIKGRIQHEYSSKLEILRSDLNAKSGVAIERLKNQLQVETAIYNIRFTKTFERTAEVIAETYQQLRDIHEAALMYTSVYEDSAMGSKDDRRKKFIECANKFMRYFRRHKLYLTSETANRVEDFCSKIQAKTHRFMKKVHLPEHTNREVDTDAWADIDTFMAEGVKPLFEILEQDFRENLGIESIKGRVLHSESV